jgi:hypothetical protein
MSEATVEKPGTTENGELREVRVKTAYISAPRSMDTSDLRATLENKGVQAFSADQVDSPSQNLTEVLQEGMQQADLVVAVLDPTPDSNFVYYELGFAQALRKPTVVLVAGDVSTSPWTVSGIPYFRFDPANPTGLEFGISQILKAPQLGMRPSSTPPRRTHPLGARADELLEQLRAPGDKLRVDEFEAIIAQAIRESGVTAVAQGTDQDKRVDLAVLCDELSPWIGNPLLIDLCLAARNRGALETSVKQLVRALAGGSMLWGMLIYYRADIDVAQAVTTPNILCLSAEEFLEALRETSFGDLIRRLRNERVHGRR